MKVFAKGELNHFNRIFEYIRRGGIAVLSGAWDKMLELSDYVERKKAELVMPACAKQSAAGRQRQAEWGRKSGKQMRRQREKRSLSGMLRLMVVADESGCLDVEPPFEIPYLLNLVGDTVGVNEGCPFLVPVSVVQEIQASLSNSYVVSLLGEDVVASRNVFPPNSPETIALFFAGLKGLSIADCRLSIEKADNQQSTINNHQSSIIDVLDMGCGSGCLSLLVAQVFEGRNINIVATDHLPEALATTKINIQKFIQLKRIPANVIEVTKGGDLFEPILGRCFDVIIFNAPWVVAPARNRAETAIHDQHQNTVRRFFAQAGKYLKDVGYILLGYSDNSGSKAIEKLEDIIQKAGFQIVNLFKERVQTHRSKRKWETIFVYTCVKCESNG
ncbi:class I SAM-dependent methyltransferase [Candidatus Poribacteria bacterium]|nr:class I SAM-dependent methyltransferase [Candidatus Poribacteria bacterium]